MFMELSLTKGRICINVNKVLFFCETKKGTSITLEDGTMIDIDEAYDEMILRFQRHTEGTFCLKNTVE